MQSRQTAAAKSQGLCTVNHVCRSRSVHLELVQRPSYQDLMGALCIFFAHHGVPGQIFSCNAKAFLKEKFFLTLLTPANKIGELQYTWARLKVRKFCNSLMSVVRNSLRSTLESCLVSKRKTQVLHCYFELLWPLIRPTTVACTCFGPRSLLILFSHPR